MMKYEYKTILEDCREMENAKELFDKKLNSYGREGWELVCAFTHPYIGSSQYSLIGIAHRMSLIFKRPVEKEAMV